ncbi:MAG: hypothetical protein M3Q71_07860 [Chloroflexota bacterium]|nr:hypothetical protein [Chloroflexota bacterium]
MTAATLDQPRILPVCLDGIPKELAIRPQWVAWRWEHRPGEKKEWAKVPINPRNGNRASVTNHHAWTTVYLALSAVKRYDCAGIGYVFIADDPYTGIDQDGVRDPVTGEIDESALEIIRRFGSYTEPSVSGTGLHSIVKGKLPKGRRRRGPIETYDDGRFFCFTGQPLPGYDVIRDAGDELPAWHAETIGLLDPEPSPTPITVQLDLTDNEVLERAFKARNGDKTRRLYEGDLSDYGGDASAADLALCSHLCFWTQDDEQVARIVAASGLNRPKWDREDYRRRTIAKARSSGTTYDPAYSQPLPSGPESQDAGLVERDPALPDDPDELKRIVVLQRRKIVSLEAQYALLAQRYRATMAALASPNLGPEKVTAIVVADELERQATSVAAKPTADGAYPVPLARIAERTGDSEEAVSRKLKKLERLDLFERQVKYIPRHVNPETGEVTGDRNMTYLRPKVEPTVMYQVVAAAPPSEKGKKNGHGGARTICPDHPNAGTVKRWTLHCAECDKPLDKGEETIKPQELTDGPNPQDAGLVASGAENVPEPAEQTPRGYPLRSDGKSATCYNDDTTFHNDQPRRSSRVDAPPGSIATLWQAGQALPGFDALPPVPPDPYTDVAYGRRAP